MISIISNNPLWFGLFLTLSVLALTIILERAWILYKKTPLLAEKDELQLIEYIRSDRFEDALSFCRLQSHPGYRVVAKLIETRNSSYKAETIAKEETMRQIASFEKYVPSLGTISTVSPLLGLLGTVTGMIQSFRAFGESASRSTQLMGGIDSALMTTAFGLIIAIPSLIMYNYFVRRINALAEETDILVEIYFNEVN